MQKPNIWVMVFIISHLCSSLLMRKWQKESLRLMVDLKKLLKI